jgi:hypothetical protein
MEPRGQVKTNQTGRFITPLSNDNNYLLIIYNYNSNGILVEPIKNRTGASILVGYQALYAKLYAVGLRPCLQCLDNKCAKPLKALVGVPQWSKFGGSKSRIWRELRVQHCQSAPTLNKKFVFEKLFNIKFI